jgi:hypothetical protein
VAVEVLNGETLEDLTSTCVEVSVAEVAEVPLLKTGILLYLLVVEALVMLAVTA